MKGSSMKNPILSTKCMAAYYVVKIESAFYPKSGKSLFYLDKKVPETLICDKNHLKWPFFTQTAIINCKTTN